MVHQLDRISERVRERELRERCDLPKYERCDNTNRYDESYGANNGCHKQRMFG